jgi:hypothetical protein
MCSVAVGLRVRSSVLVLTLGLTLLATACGGHYVSRGSALYEDGRYVEAAEVFEQTEQRLASSSSSERARFGLYRGATFLRLGDVTHAARWLGYARSIKKSDPSSLDGEDTELLDASLKALGASPSELERKPNTELATAPAP